MNRLKRVQVSAQLIHHTLMLGTRETKVVSDPLPEDAVLVAANFDGRTVTLTYHSAAFEPVGDGELIPVLAPMFRSEEAAR